MMTVSRRFSPRMWRCFLALPTSSPLADVFSTHVEMFLLRSLRLSGFSGFLHACGDVSGKYEIPDKPSIVFSTHVEMFLTKTDESSSDGCFLHACGDVSALLDTKSVENRFSPRMWRCFSLAV